MVEQQKQQPVAPTKKFYKNSDDFSETAPVPPPRPLIAPKLPVKPVGNTVVKPVYSYPLEDDIYTGLKPNLNVNKFYSNATDSKENMLTLPNDFILKMIVNNNTVIGLQNGKIVQLYTEKRDISFCDSSNNRQFYELIQVNRAILAFQDTGFVYKLTAEGQLKMLLRDAIPMGRRKIYLRPEVDEIWVVGVKETSILAVNKEGDDVGVVRVTPTHFPDATNLIFLDAEEMAVFKSDRSVQIYSLPRFGHSPALIAKIPAVLGDIVKVIKIYAINGLDVYGTIYSDGKMMIWRFTDGKGLIERVTVPLTLFRIQTVHSTKEFHWLGLNNGKIIAIRLDAATQKVSIVCEVKWHQTAVIKFIKTQRDGEIVSVDANGQICSWDENLTLYKQNKIIWEREEDYCQYERVSVRICSWNAAAQNPGDCSDTIADKWLGLDSSLKMADLIVISLQEIIDLSARNFINDDQSQSGVLDQWIRFVQRRLPSEYKLVHSSMMVGLGLIVLCRDEVKGQLGSVSEDSVKTGLGGLHGNKGALVWRTFIYDTPVAFVACHLAAGQAAVSERNTDAATILRTATFCEARKDPSAFPTGNSGTKLFDHSAIFFAGDLNYRIDLDRSNCLKKISEGNLKELERKDQLTAQRNRKELLLSYFREQRPEFVPTYKYDRGSVDRFDSSEKARVPAWCDRILFYSKRPDTITAKEYKSIQESTLSDHKPIFATFELKCRKINHPLRSNLFRIS